MQTPQRNQTPYENVLSAWREQLAQAAENPHLKQRLSNQERELLPRFASHYTKLAALPRKLRRAMQRQYKQSLAGVALLLALGQAPALAATITVGGGCSLVNAITAANTDTLTGGCTAGNLADTLVLPAPPALLPALTTVNNTTPYGATGLPVVTSAIIIQGNGATIRRAITAPEFRIFAVGVGGRLTLQQTTVSGGRLPATFVGGGVYNKGTITLTNSTIAGNVASYGGGVFNNGTFTMTGSTVSGNDAVDGAGVFNDDIRAFTMTNSTISGNDASNEGGGVRNRGTATLINGTISDNSADFQGGGVYNVGTLTLDSTLISGNTAPTAPEVYNTVNGTVTANNFNLFGFNDDAGVTGFTPVPTDVVPPVGVLLTDILEPLADNPGATPLVTQTHALVAGSPALNAVGEGCPPPALDQRGITRPQGVACDIGSFELEEAVAPENSPPSPARN
jgi:hypothetical protein